MARLVLRNDDAAADAVQDALLAAWLDLRSLRDPDRFDAWLYRVLVSSCRRAAQRARGRRVAEIAVVDGFRTAVGDAQAAVAERDEMDRAFRLLTPDERMVLVLRHHVGMSVPEMADTARVPLGTMKARLSRATGALRAALDADARGIPSAEEVPS
jgi:RNA polymerase sigma-70 factor (ECF subfamily)